MKSRLTLGVVLVTLLVSGLAAGWWWSHRGTDFTHAVAGAPEDAQRVLWTDWSALGAETGTTTSTDPTADELAALLDAGFRRDLTSTSALLSSAEGLRRLGLSPPALDWELFTQGDQGAAVVLAPLAGTGGLDDRLEDVGFDRPDAADGTWLGGPDVAARLGLGPELQHWVVLEDEGLAIASDNAPYAAVAAAAARERDGDGALGDVAGELGEPVSAVLLTGTHACEHLAMAGADEADQEQAAVLLDAAGGVSPYSAFAMALLPGGDARVTLAFERDDQAAHDATSRGVLAAGEATGQGGDFSERFRVLGTSSSGRVAALDLRPEPGAFPLSDLTSGPVLFASC